jgi:ribosomal protein S18 acetylase RimI-like enzyme
MTRRTTKDPAIDSHETPAGDAAKKHASTVLVRRAEARDLDALAKMGALLAELHFEFDRARFLFSSLERVAEGYRGWFQRELENASACLLVVDGDVPGALRGYAYGRAAGIDWAALLDKHAALVDLYVHESGRGQGTGEALVEAFCAWAHEKGLARVVLSTATPNVTAQALFRRLGFRATMIEMTRETDR